NAAAGEIWGGAAPIAEIPDHFYAQFRAWRASSGEPVAPSDWALHRAIREGHVTRAEELEIECFDTSRKTILNYAVPIRNAFEHVVGGIALAVDITERKREAWLQQMLAEASA